MPGMESGKVQGADFAKRLLREAEGEYSVRAGSCELRVLRSPSFALLLLLGFVLVLTRPGAALSGDPEPAQLAGITAAHNRVRARVNPPASPALRPLRYSSTVAATAQVWADGCNYSHNPGRGALGENIHAYATTGRQPSKIGLAAVAAWASEASDYDYSGNTCGDVCGHYTQIVWRDTTDLGCGVAFCSSGSPFGARLPDWWYVVCNYGPPGNYVGRRPY